MAQYRGHSIHSVPDAFRSYRSYFLPSLKYSCRYFILQQKYWAARRLLEGKMPKIEVNERLFFNLLSERYDYDTLETKLMSAKAELDEKPDCTQPESERVIKIELNDTNRPDLWSTGGIARQLRLHSGKTAADYGKYMSASVSDSDFSGRIAIVDPALQNIRPYMVAFVITGKAIDEPMLLDIIQTQEKLAWNFGRKRKSLSMGVYRSELIHFPVHYKAVDPDKTSFIPLQGERPMTCRQILSDHPKGKDFGWILQDMERFPLLTDDAGEPLSMPPIINSATLGAVQTGDRNLMVELTGDNMENLILAANIVACDFIDCGYRIEPILVKHPYETGFGKDIAVPFYFQKPTKARLSNINRLLGSDFDAPAALEALKRMGNTVEAEQMLLDGKKDTEFTVNPPPYRNDFLHEADVIEDVMIGAGLDSFEPEMPKDFTIGRLLPITQLSRKTKGLLVGLGYQEMIFNYVGSQKDYITNMNNDGSAVIEIANPMSENYQFIRPDIISSLLRAESKSSNAVFPHKIFEIGKVAYLAAEENTGTRTATLLGFLRAGTEADFNTIAGEVSALLYFLDHEYDITEGSDPRFIAGRQAVILADGKPICVFGEIHPQILENWSITVPCAACEIDLEKI